MKKSVKNFLYILLCLVATSGCSKDDEYVVKKIKVELVNGSSKIVRFEIPKYATIGVHSSRGSYRLSTWKYCMGGMLKCEVTLMQGVVYYELLD